MDEHGWRVGVFAVVIVAAAGFGGLAAVVSGRTPEPAFTEPLFTVKEEAMPDLKTYIGRVDEALARGDLSAAVFEWNRARGAALGPWGWEAMVAVGDAALRLAARDTVPAAFEEHARDAYLTALIRARSARSAYGARRVAEAFEQLRDPVLIAHARAVADDLERRRPVRRATGPSAVSLP